MTLTPETVYPLLSALCFAGLVAVTLAGALLASVCRNLIYCVCSLALSFVGLAGLYLYLNSPFLALMQVLIYVGAVCIVILFAIMLAGTLDDKTVTKKNAVLAGVASFLAAGMLAVALVLLISRTAWMPPATPVNAGTVQDIGRALLGRFGFAFELISAVLLLAILGALVVARKGRDTLRD
jgi:NADH-quinone oxidoreductase subunit J